MASRVRRILPTSILWPLLILAFVLASWEAGIWHSVFGIESFVLPRPSEIASSAVENRDKLTENFVRTVRPAILGFAAGNLAGFLAALTLVLLPGWIGRGFSTSLVAIQAVPLVAVVPIVALYLGGGDLFKLVTVTILILPPTMIYWYRGMTQIDERTLDLMASYDAGRIQAVRKARLPHAVPFAFTSMRYTWILALIGVLVCEILRVSEGLGAQAFDDIGRFEAARGWTAVTALAMTGAVVYGLLMLLERVAFPWSFQVDDSHH